MDDSTVDVVNFPSFKEGKADDSAIVYGLGNGDFHISTKVYYDEKKRNACIKFFKYLTSEEAGNLIVNSSGSISNIKSVYRDKISDILLKGDALRENSKELVGPPDSYVERTAWDNMMIKNFPDMLKGNKAGFKADEIIPYDYIYKMALKKAGSMCWITYPYSTSFNDIYGAKIIYNRDTFKPIGLMVMIIKKKYVESMYSDLSIESYNSIAILSEDRDTIVKSKDTEDRILFLIDKLTNKAKNYFVDNDSKSLISYVDIDQPQWRIIYCIPVKELYSEINELRITIILLVIISILVLSILSSFTAIDILNPIN